MNTKIISWNVNGIRSIIRKELWYPFVNTELPDIICLQEVRASGDQFKLSGEFNNDYPYQYFNNHSTKKGYSGTAIFSKIQPINVTVPEFDVEGRVQVAEFNNYFLVNVYVPNSGTRFEYRTNTWDHLFREYLIGLTKPPIICGDFNVAKDSIDIYNPKIKNKAGVMPEERENFKELLKIFVDSFRQKNPKTIKFSWWSNMFKSRSKNNGWRIDYFLVDKSINFMDADILDHIQGSDHAPVMLLI